MTKSWLIWFIPPLLVILVAVAAQLYRTRRAMAEFARMHHFSYERPTGFPGALFGLGRVHGTIDHGQFTMGLQLITYDFGPSFEQRQPEEKSPGMHLTVDGMPHKMVIRKREAGRLGQLHELLSSRSKVPMVRTGDEDFDSRAEVVGYAEEVLPWLTPGRRAVLAAFVDKDGYVVTRGGLAYRNERTHIRLAEMEEALAWLLATQRKL